MELLTILNRYCYSTRNPARCIRAWKLGRPKAVSAEEEQGRTRMTENIGTPPSTEDVQNTERI